MNLKEAQKKLKLSPETIDEYHADVTRLVVSDEFNRLRGLPASHSFQENAIDRLLKAKISFDSEGNILWNVREDHLPVLQEGHEEHERDRVGRSLHHDLHVSL